MYSLVQVRGRLPAKVIELKVHAYENLMKSSRYVKNISERKMENQKNFFRRSLTYVKGQKSTGKCDINDE